MVGRRAVDAHVGRVGFGAEIIRDRAAHGQASGLDPGAGFPAGTVAEVGEELVEPAHAEGLAMKSHERPRKDGEESVQRPRTCHGADVPGCGNGNV